MQPPKHLVFENIYGNNNVGAKKRNIFTFIGPLNVLQTYEKFASSVFITFVAFICFLDKTCHLGKEIWDILGREKQ